MMSGNQICIKTIVASIMVALIMTVQPVNADTILPIEQHRVTSTLVIVPQCGGKGFDNEIAENFELFESEISSELICYLAGSVATAHQTSQINPNSLTASGGATSAVNAEVQGTIHAISGSSFDVTFEVSTARSFSLNGMILADTFGDLEIGAIVQVKLSGPANTTIFEFAVDSADGEQEALELSKTGILQPGQYTLRADAGSFIDNGSPPSRSADAFYDFNLDVLCIGDLDGNGTADTSDLLELFAQWGTDGLADFDESGAVGTADLLILFANWGPC